MMKRTARVVGRTPGSPQSAWWCAAYGLLVMLVSVSGCDLASNRPEAAVSDSRLLVAAAANTKSAFEIIEREFERTHPNVDLRVTVGSSGSLYAQITERAPFDVFFSADQFYPDKLVAQSFAESEDRFIYAEGKLVIAARRGSNIDLQKVGARALLDESVVSIAIANPELAPYGRAAEEMMQHYGLLDQVRPKLVYSDNVAQAASHVQSGAADLGIIGGSLTYFSSTSVHWRSWEVPAGTHEPIRQAAVVLGDRPHRRSAQQLRAFVTSERGRAIWRRCGYEVPESP